MSTRIAVVTGANKGIGYAVIKGLAPVFDGTIYLTARNEKLGLEAVKKLEDENKIKVKFHQLDISNQESIERFAKYLKETYGGLDILINNAAIAIDNENPMKFAERARRVIPINFTGTLNLCNALFPLLRPHARVVNVSSRAGMLKSVVDDGVKKRLISDDLTVEELSRIVDDYVRNAHDDHPILDFNQEMKSCSEIKNRLPNHVLPNAYSMSKAALNALTRLQQEQFDRDARQDLLVNALTPGYVKTDMTQHKGGLTPEQGADTIVFLATLPVNFDGPKGTFWAERKVFDWTDKDWIMFI